MGIPAVPDHPAHQYPEGRALFLHRHAVDAGRKPAEHLPQPVKVRITHGVGGLASLQLPEPKPDLPVGSGQFLNAPEDGCSGQRIPSQGQTVHPAGDGLFILGKLGP